MADQNRLTTWPNERADMGADAGLRAFMLGVYGKLAMGLLLSAACAYATSSVEPVRALLFAVTPEGAFAGYTWLGLAVLFAPLLVMLGALLALPRRASAGAGILFWALSALIGASLGVLVLVYTSASLATAFLFAAAGFAALSIFGAVTRSDLSGMGAFLMVALIGLILATLVQMFWNPPGFSFVVSAAGVLIFAGLVAYDTQRLKRGYYEWGQGAERSAATSMGALSLYLDFLNLFQFLLTFVGRRRR
ncbi:MAG: Bax inhibitor-1/YccA family protein [Hyphomonadaceae bacterium]|nr:Bax inhibitor-1/YccA family protein [Hyphomonadaceae bacterium]